MSQENVEIVRRTYAAYFDRHDREEYASLLHPGVELVRASSAPEKTMRRGVD
jgi:ketosteroid isomerase-like protein